MSFIFMAAIPDTYSVVSKLNCVLQILDLISGDAETSAIVIVKHGLTNVVVNDRCFERSKVIVILDL